MNQWVIWSEEHQAWWRPDCAGYTASLKLAGRYTEDRARSIVHNANMGGGRFNELAFPLPPTFDAIVRLETER